MKPSGNITAYASDCIGTQSAVGKGGGAEELPGRSLPYLQAVESLRVVVCVTCGMTHALPEAAYLIAQRAATALYCPRGHAWIPKGENEADALNGVSERIELLAALADARSKLEALRWQLAETLPPEAGPLGAAELRRRAKIVANRGGASAGDLDRAICLFCGRMKPRGALARHIRREHAEPLTAKPAAFFGQEGA